MAAVGDLAGLENVSQYLDPEEYSLPPDFSLDPDTLQAYLDAVMR